MPLALFADGGVAACGVPTEASALFAQARIRVCEDRPLGGYVNDRRRRLTSKHENLLRCLVHICAYLGI